MNFIVDEISIARDFLSLEIIFMEGGKVRCMQVLGSWCLHGSPIKFF